MNENEKLVREQNPTLAQRGSIYGPYAAGLQIREEILLAITTGYERHHEVPMSERYCSYFFDIANKLCRLAICPSHEDSWHDIVGYGQLIETAVKEENKK